MNSKRRDALFMVYFNSCAYCKEPFSNQDIREAHHGGVHNTVGNRKNYPLFIESLINLFPMHRKCHEKHPGFGSMNEIEVEKYELLFQAFCDLVYSGASINLKLVMKEFELLRQEIER